MELGYVVLAYLSFVLELVLIGFVVYPLGEKWRCVSFGLAGAVGVSFSGLAEDLGAG